MDSHTHWRTGPVLQLWIMGQGPPLHLTYTVLYPITSTIYNTIPTFYRKMYTVRDLNVGTWNIRSLFATGRLALVMNDFKTNDLDLLALQETFWPDSGEFVTDGHLIRFSGADLTLDPRNRAGTGFIVSPKLRPSILGAANISPISAPSKYTPGRTTLPSSMHTLRTPPTPNKTMQ